MSTQTADFLVELGSEELPPKALLSLSQSFASSIQKQLDDLQLSYAQVKAFATPRRLAVLVESLATQQADREEEKLGPPVKAAFDQDGNPTKVAEGFARSNNVNVEDLEQKDSDKGLRLAVTVKHTGQASAQLLPEVVQQALNNLPIPKRMRWGSSRTEFIRPVHWLVMLMDSTVVDANILDLTSGAKTLGHRFHHPEALEIDHAKNYESILESQAFVIADFEKRQEAIREQVIAAAQKLGGEAKLDEDLLNEVCALVEWPVVLAGKFDEEFLEVPAEALISSMQEHQKYFAVFDTNKKLLPNFITVSNLNSPQPELIIEGNEKVIRPRLSDAAFFFNTDKKQTLESRLDGLKNVVFQKQLGSLFEKTTRIQTLASKIAEQCGFDKTATERAAQLCKADLISDMVFEFSDMQGIAGSYYAQADGESEHVATAIKEHYLPKFAGDALPETQAGIAVALADRIDTLVGIFGINQIPTGSKDPFALRRASVSILRLIIEKSLDLDLKTIFEVSANLHGDNLSNDNTVQQSLDYALERLRAWYEEQNIATPIYLSVAAKNLSAPLDIDQRVKAVAEFSKLAAADSLAAANKRVSNILAKAENTSTDINTELLQENSEQVLNKSLQDMLGNIAPLIESKQYQATLEELAKLQAPVDDFFENVMVMADDEALRNNRLALLQTLRNAFLNIADISHLA